MSANANNLIHAEFRLPPQSLEAEQCVLGALMLSDQAHDIAADILNIEDFYRKEHRLIFQAMIALANDDKPRDVLTLSEWLGEDLEQAGGMLYLGTLAKDTPSAANVKAYAEIVREKSLLRSIIASSEENIQLAHNPERLPVDEILNQAQSKIISLSETRSSRALPTTRDLLSKAIDVIDHRFNHQGEPVGLPSGLSNLDKEILGFEPQDLIIVAGRPSMGKTAFTMNIAENAAIKHNKPVAVFSMEMSGDQLMLRMLSSVGGIDFWKIRTGKLGDSDWPKLTSATSQINRAPIFIDDRPALSVAQIRSRCRNIRREHGLGLVVVDYMQLMTAQTKENRATQIGEISRGLKEIAKEMNVPVIALSQLNRGLENRTEKRPMMSDLRESGAIEQDADVIIFLYRDVVYHKDTKYPDVAEAIITKQRNGPVSTAYLYAALHRMKFLDHTDEIPEYGNGYDKKGGLD